MSLKSQATSGLKWQVIELLGRQLLSLLIFGTLSRLLDQSSFGTFGLINIFLAFVGMFASQGIRAALIQRQDLQPEHIDTAYWYSLGGASLICIGTIIFAEPISNMLGEPSLTPYLRCSSLLLVLTASATIHNTLFVRELDFRRPAIRLLLSNLTGGVVGITMAIHGFGVWALVWQQLTVAITSAVFLWSASSYRPSFRFSYAHYRELTGVSTSVFATSLLWFLTSRLDQLIISRFAGTTSLGYYIVGNRLPELAKLITHQPISQVSTPTLARLQNDHAKMRSAIYQGTALNALLSFAVFVGISAVASDLVPLVFGAKWQDSAPVCSLLAIYILIGVLQVFIHPALIAVGANRDYVLVNVWQTVGAFAACWIGIHYGITFVAFGMLLNGLLASIPSFYLLKKWVGLEITVFLKKCAYPALAAAIMYGVIHLLNMLVLHSLPLAFRLTAKVVAGATCYLTIIWVFDKTVLNALTNMFSQALQRKSVRPVAP